MSRGEGRRASRGSSATHESLAESEARHRVMVDALPQGVVLQAADGSILAVNPAAIELLGLDPTGPARRRAATAASQIAAGAPEAGSDGTGDDTDTDFLLDSAGVVSTGRVERAADQILDLSKDEARSEADAEALEDEADLAALDDEEDPDPGQTRRARVPPQIRGAIKSAVAARPIARPAAVIVAPKPPTRIPAQTLPEEIEPGRSAQRGASSPGSQTRVLRTVDLTDAGQAPMLAVGTGLTQRKLAGPLRASDGGAQWLSITAVPLLDTDGSVHAVVSSITDGSADHEHELTLRRSEELFRQTMEHTPVGFAILAVDGRFLRVNRMLCRHFGYRADELHERRLIDLVHPDDRIETGAKIELVMSGEKDSIQLERRFSGNGEMLIWCVLSLSLVRDDDGAPQLVIAQLLDVSEIRKAHELLTHMALHDPLTGLPNRTLVLDRIQKSLDRSRRSGKRVAVLVCDLDHFKVVNDGVGHELGDAVIIEVSKRLQRALRAADTAGRIGGDEFIVVCEDVEDEREAIAVAERIQRAVSEPATVGERTVVPTISIGIAVSTGPAAEPLTLIRDADTAKYRAKEYGRNRWDIVDVALRKQATERLDLEQSLRQALDEGQLRLHFQPIVDLATREVVGREALLRWVHPQRGLLGPSEFLQVAEESGLITEIGRWVIHEAARIAGQARDSSGYVAVNVSPSQVSRPGLADTVEKVLAETGLPPERLVVELTESVMLSAAPAARKEISRLDDFGVRIVVDDFGTGFSALSYLRDLPVSGIKVDRSFTAGLGQDHQCERIVEALTGLGKGLGVDVIVEGVETEQQSEMLSAIGCEHAQGYLFGRPVPNFEPLDEIRI
jgi:diguanylate cyclase (GGDEF)-like protein/PAS domain S-box-containing protein